MNMNSATCENLRSTTADNEWNNASSTRIFSQSPEVEYNFAENRNLIVTGWFRALPQDAPAHAWLRTVESCSDRSTVVWSVEACRHIRNKTTRLNTYTCMNYLSMYGCIVVSILC